LRNGYSNSITIEKQHIKLYNRRKMAHQTTKLLNNSLPKALIVENPVHAPNPTKKQLLMRNGYHQQLQRIFIKKRKKKNKIIKEKLDAQVE
jgi:hypothetical protein